MFAPDEWVPTPGDWAPSVQRGRIYDLDRGEGQRLWQSCLERATSRQATADWALDAFQRQRAGRPMISYPRFGQGSFRLAVLSAYGERCAVTTERSLPVLEAAHIRPWAAGGTHEITNGIPLRRDLHRLYDLGYVTIRPDLSFAVSRRLRDEYANGRVYYELDGRQIHRPHDPAAAPSLELLAWHEAEIFRPQ
jgi:putative restriction endonuclease